MCINVLFGFMLGIGLLISLIWLGWMNMVVFIILFMEYFYGWRFWGGMGWERMDGC